MADYHVTAGDVAVIEVNNPPVNALSYHVRKAIQEGVENANKDSRVHSIVICGRGTFIAGADIKEFSTGEYSTYPTITELTFVIEDSKKPVVAAVQGFALGGGLEVALVPTLADVCSTIEESNKPVVAVVNGSWLGGGFLLMIACHYRISATNGQYGFPEVNIGILPAATGTQRFPRVAGLKAALDIIPSGRRFGAKEAMQIGVLDKVSQEKDIMKEGVSFAKSVAKKPLTGRHTTRGPIRDAEHAETLMQAALTKAQKKTPGLLAPIFNIKAVMASVQGTREEGLENENLYAIQLFTSYQSRSLQYAFFAERAATKWEIPGASYKTTKPTKLTSGAVIGAGQMGTGIAMSMLNGGMSVVLLEQNRKFLDKGVATLKDLYAGSVRLGKVSKAKAEKCLSMLKPTTDYADLKNVDVAVEAVYEDMKVKQEVFRKLDQICHPKTYLWSNTSALNIDEIGSVTSRPEKVIGAHFFIPAYHMRLLENVRSRVTSPETIATAMQFGVQIGKVPVLVGNCPGFIGNRLQAQMNQESMFLLEEGCLPEDVDQVHEDFGFPLGIFKIRDLAGGHVGYMARNNIAKKLGLTLSKSTRYFNGAKYSAISDMLGEQKRFGRITGKGFYKYEKPQAKVPFVDQDVIDMILDYSKFLGIERRRISTKEITERLYYPLINEGFKVLEAGLVSKPEDIDTVWLLGYSWPRQYGGPMYYADMVGVENIYNRICHYYELYPDCPYWQPSQLLKRIVQDKVPFKKWAKHAQNSETSKL